MNFFQIKALIKRIVCTTSNVLFVNGRVDGTLRSASLSYGRLDEGAWRLLEHLLSRRFASRQWGHITRAFSSLTNGVAEESELMSLQ